MPGATTGIALVRLDLSVMLKMAAILIDEIPDETINIIFSPVQPVLNAGLNVPH